MDHCWLSCGCPLLKRGRSLANNYTRLHVVHVPALPSVLKPTATFTETSLTVGSAENVIKGLPVGRARARIRTRISVALSAVALRPANDTRITCLLAHARPEHNGNNIIRSRIQPRRLHPSHGPPDTDPRSRPPDPATEIELDLGPCACECGACITGTKDFFFFF